MLPAFRFVTEPPGRAYFRLHAEFGRPAHRRTSDGGRTDGFQLYRPLWGTDSRVLLLFFADRIHVVTSIKRIVPFDNRDPPYAFNRASRRASTFSLPSSHSVSFKSRP